MFWSKKRVLVTYYLQCGFFCVAKISSTLLTTPSTIYKPMLKSTSISY